jgi:hypothetical protein
MADGKDTPQPDIATLLRQAAAQDPVRNYRKRLFSVADRLLDRLVAIALSDDVPPAVSLAATRDALDRLGMTPPKGDEQQSDDRPATPEEMREADEIVERLRAKKRAG